MTRRTLAAIAAVALIPAAGCGGGSGDSSSAPTTSDQSEATTSSKPTKKVISSAAIHALLIRPGDLPSGFLAGQVRLRPPEMFNGLPRAAVTATRQFSSFGETKGGVTVFIYQDASARDRAYRRLVSDLGVGYAKPYRALNASARISTLPYPVAAIDLVFKHCTALVHVRMSGTNEPDDAGSYASALDARLAPLVC
jgi:hypothetical protein